MNHIGAMCKQVPPCFIRDDYPQPNTTQGVIMYCPLHAAAPRMQGLLILAGKYLVHPDVKSVAFAVPSEAVASRIFALLAEIEGKETNA